MRRLKSILEMQQQQQNKLAAGKTNRQCCELAIGKK